MNEEIKSENLRIHSRADELIACLEVEIAKRDEELAACRVAVENCDLFRARIAELEARIVWLECEAQVNAAPVSEAKAQGVVMPERKTKADYGVYIDEFADEAAAIYNAALDEVARLNATHVQQVSVPDVSSMARILADRNADACNVNREDNWAIYGRDYIDDVAAMLAAPAAPAADAGLVEALRELADQFREAWPNHTGKYHFLIGAGLSIAASRAQVVV